MRDNVIPKFRAFLIEDKTMRDVVEIDFVKNMYCLQIGRSTIGEWFWYRDLFLMQSTGLKDKNGVEIFEGDIVRFKFKNETRIGFVEYVRSSFLINVGEIICDNKIRHSFSNSSSEEHEIIGNVYQNKDLLEGLL